MTMDLTLSDVFMYRGITRDGQIVEPDARTDEETLCSLIWSVLKRSPAITLKRSRVIVGFFLRYGWKGGWVDV
jgi:hypothetical protein